ncbi:MAG: hypothetical protein LBE18_12265 [Planctomycetaceae bacterium]|jgi:hypothetical protein|nr:hypothetical protein [Planctomycetaceae bacterium]
MISKSIFRFISIFCIYCIVGAIGCRGAGLKKPDLTALLPPGPVDKALTAWTPAIQTGEQPQRGFGGRVYFYDYEAKRPIKVDGTIAVYAFDETNRTPDNNEPTRIYTFAKEDVKRNYSKSKLGHSYNLWIPWDTEGPEGEAKKISFIVRYIPDKGSSVVSQQTTTYLSGKTKMPNEMIAKNEQNNNSNIQQTAAVISTEKFNDSMRQTQSENTTIEPKKLNIDSNNYTENIIETNNNRPKKMQTTTIELK